MQESRESADHSQPNTPPEAKHKFILFRGEDRGEVLAFVLADKVRHELQRRGFEVKVVDLPYENTRHGRLMAGCPPEDVTRKSIKKYLDEVMSAEGERAIGYTFHNYDIENVVPERSAPNSFVSETSLISRDNDHQRYGVRITGTGGSMEYVSWRYLQRTRR